MSPEPIETTSESRASLQKYLIGFFLALVLTGISFAVVMSSILSPAATIATLGCAGIVQVLVHLRYFLHLDLSESGRWPLRTIMYTILIIMLFVAGGLWIIYDLHWRLM
jgi:cytochrome o ubiquinol oxidase operon protein cyoD